MSRQWTAVKVELRPSPIHGVGVFAAQKIRKRQLVATTDGAWLLPRNFVPPTKRWREWFGAYHFSWGNSKHGFVFMRGPMKFINHSCQPNIVWIDQCACFALRDIDKGEELFEDYHGFMPTFRNFGGKCRCPVCADERVPVT